MGINIEGIDLDIYSCLQCGYCTSICPMFEQLGWESASPRGKIFYIKQLTQRNLLDRILRREIEVSEEFITRMFQCTGCGACEEVCHVNIPLHELWKRVKEWFFEEGLIQIEAHKKVHDRIHQHKNPFAEPTENRGKWFPEDLTLSSTPEIVFFQGCTEAYRKQEMAETTARLLTKADVPFTILGADEWCCGSICINTGQIDYIKEFASHNINTIEKTGAKALVAACAGCYNTIKNEYPKIVGELPFKLYHVSEFLETLIRDGRLQFSKNLDMTVTFHDSCHLGRGAGVFDAPRNVINSIPGVTLVEMVRSRELSRCCGAGCGCVAAFRSIAVALATERVMEAQSTGAEKIITTCPFCNLNLNNVAQDNDLIKTMDVVQLAYQAV
ncbi:MAG: (Fe-S)-binding protein [Thermoplasmata archaeon]|nr:MAG: (Fe-S)-binding protein [Thermoplasmata archaeon]